MTGSIDVSVTVPGTPEQVWEAVATGPGISSWFVPAEVDGRLDGTVTLHFGPYGASQATVTAWEPPRRAVYAGGDDQPLVYEWFVQSRGDGTCVVRLVNSGFGEGEGSGDELESMENGWRIFLENLRLHLTHFPGRDARPFVPTVMAPGPNHAAWSALCGALGIPRSLRSGDRLETSGEGVPALSGRVEAGWSNPKVSAYLLLLDAPAPGTAFLAAEGDGVDDSVACSLYVYLYGPGAEQIEDTWTPFLQSRFQTPQQ